MAVFGLLTLQVLVPRQFSLICHSINMVWGVKENHVAVIALPNCGKFHSQIFTLLKPLRIPWMFIYPAIKHYKELWRVEVKVHSGCLKRMRAEAAIKIVWEWTCQNLVWKQTIISWKLNISVQSNHASSGTIYTWEGTSAQRDTSLLLLWRKSDRQDQSIWHAENRHENVLFTDEKIFTIEEQYNNHTRFMLKRPLRCVLRVQEAITLPTS